MESPRFYFNRGSRIRTRMNGFGDRNTSHCMIPLQVILFGRFWVVFNDREYYNKETSGSQAVFF